VTAVRTLPGWIFVAKICGVCDTKPHANLTPPLQAAFGDDARRAPAKEVNMVFRGSIQFRFLPTTAARAAFGRRLNDIATAAFRAIARTDKGLKLAHLQFRHGQDLVAVCSRVRKDGEVEIEIDVGNEQLPAVAFTDGEMSGANRHPGKLTRDKRRPYSGTIFHIAR
jgi:hypothetical protein